MIKNDFKNKLRRSRTVVKQKNKFLQRKQALKRNKIIVRVSMTSTSDRSRSVWLKMIQNALHAKHACKINQLIKTRNVRFAKNSKVRALVRGRLRARWVVYRLPVNDPIGCGGTPELTHGLSRGQLMDIPYTIFPRCTASGVALK